MKKLLIFIILLIGINSYGASIWLNNCRNIDENEISYSFESCVNHNFSEINWFLQTFSRSCYSHGEGVPFIYEDCINSNFRNLLFEIPVHFDNCHNLGDKVSWFFTRCINRNFSEVERYINYQYGNDE